MPHTPGPWLVRKTEREDYAPNDPFYPHRLDIVAATGLLPELTTAMCRFRQETEANAYLMAAAPELLEALEAVLGSYGINYLLESDEDAACLLQAQTAIKKARGQA